MRPDIIREKGMAAVMQQSCESMQGFVREPARSIHRRPNPGVTAHLARDGFSVGETYADYAISGATTLRPGTSSGREVRMPSGSMSSLPKSLDRFSRDRSTSLPSIST